MVQDSLKSVKIAGSSTIAGGHYDVVSVSGSAQLDGDVTARQLEASGSVQGHGKVIAERLQVSGSVTFAGDLEVGEGHVSGSLVVEDHMLAHQKFHVSGSFRVDGDIRGAEVDGSGSLRSRSIALDRFHWSGEIRCAGLLTADWVELDVYGLSQVGEIAGEHLKVALGKPAKILSWLPWARPGHLSVLEISADDMYLEETTAQLVRGDRIVIGPGCQIRRVEYFGSLSIDDDSEVSETVRISR